MVIDFTGSVESRIHSTVAFVLKFIKQNAKNLGNLVIVKSLEETQVVVRPRGQKVSKVEWTKIPEHTKLLPTGIGPSTTVMPFLEKKSKTMTLQAAMLKSMSGNALEYGDTAAAVTEYFVHKGFHVIMITDSDITSDSRANAGNMDRLISLFLKKKDQSLAIFTMDEGDIKYIKKRFPNLPKGKRGIPSLTVLSDQ